MADEEGSDSRDRVMDWLSDAQRILEERMVEGGGELQPALFVRRKGCLVFVMSSGDPWAVVRLSPVAVSGFEADELTLAVDTYSTKSQTNPEGKPWRHGEMQERAHEPAVAALLSEAVMVLRARREGEAEMAVAMYERQAGGRIAWSDPKASEAPGGAMADALREAVRAPWLEDIVGAPRPKDFGLPPREAEAHRRMGAVRAMSISARLEGSVVAFAFPADDDPVVRRIVHESLRRAGLDAEVRTFGGDKREWWRS